MQWLKGTSSRILFQQINVRSHVGKWGISGRTVLLAETT
jgi:hypothetical protein